MLTEEGCRRRRERLWQMVAEDCQWVLVSDPKHLVYFANFWKSPFTYSASDAGAMLLLRRGGEAVLIGDNLTAEAADEAHVDRRVLPTWYDGKNTPRKREAHLVENVLVELRECIGTRFGVERSHLPVGIVEGLTRMGRGTTTFTDVDPWFRELKRQKEPDEIALIEQSARAMEASLDALRAEAKVGMSEVELFLIAQRSSQQFLGSLAPLYGDFSCGTNCESGGGPPTSRRIAPGDTVLVDYSVVIRGYRADFANPYTVGGAPTDSQRKVFDACLEAMAAGEAALRPGRTGGEVDAAVRGSLARHGLAAHFPHHTGHGIGLSHPEPPFLVPQSEEQLLIGDVVTIEPGVYIPGVAGIRTERTYEVTANGPRPITRQEFRLEAG